MRFIRKGGRIIPIGKFIKKNAKNIQEITGLGLLAGSVLTKDKKKKKMFDLAGLSLLAYPLLRRLKK